MSGPRRRAPVLAASVALLLCVALARTASAQLGTAGTTGTTAASLADGDIFIGIQQTPGSNLAAFDLQRFFNKANCDCNVPVYVYFTLTQSGFAKRSLVPNGTVSFFVGTSCNDAILQKTNCHQLGTVTSEADGGVNAGAGSEPISTFMQLGRETLSTTAQIISTPSTNAVSIDGGVITSTPTTTTGPCTSTVSAGFDQTVWAVFDYNSDGTFDFSAQQAVHVDLVPPPAPANITVSPGNEALTVRWTPVDYTLNLDLQGYQILCERGEHLQVFPTGTFTPAVKTCATGRGTGVASLDPAFVCSPLLNRSDASFRTKILQNGIPYLATVVAIDNSGNPSAPYINGVADEMNYGPASTWQMPAPTLSFFDVYRNGDITNGGPGQMATPGQATGGFCAVAADDRRGRWGMGLGAGALVAGLCAWARRRRRS